MLAMVLVLTSTGCSSVVKGVDAGDGSVFVRGRLEALVDSALPEVEKAAHGAMEELNFVAVATMSDKLKGEVTARMADGTKVKIKLEAQDFDSTKLSIRVGTFGDQSISVQILRHIKRRL